MTEPNRVWQNEGDAIPVTLTIEGMSTAWSVTINGSPAMHIGDTPDQPVYLAVIGPRVRVIATMGRFRRSATLAIGPGDNVVEWREFRLPPVKSNRSAIAAVSVAAATATVVYLGRR